MDQQAPWQRLATLTGVALAALALVSVWFLVLYFAAEPLRTADTFWHLASGRYFLEQGGLTATDPFAHTTEGRTWILQSWLFQLLLGGLEALGGLAAVRALGLVLNATLLVLLWRFFARRKVAPVFAMGCLALLGVACWLRFTQLRPHLVTAIFFLVFCEGLYLHRQRVTRSRLLVFALLQCVWTNVHAAAVMGPVFYGLAWVAERAADSVRARLGAPPEEACLPWHGLLALVAGSLITPNHVWTYWFAFGNSEAAKLIHDEWGRLSPFQWGDPGLGVLPVVTLVLWIVLLAPIARLAWARAKAAPTWREWLLGWDPRELTFALAGLAAGLVALRLVWLWFLPLAFCFARREPARPDWRLGLAWAALCAGVAWGFVGQLPRKLELGHYLERSVNEDLYPARACDVFLEAGLEGRIYNHYTYGGYLISRLYPRAKVFVDGRTFLYMREMIEGDYRTVAVGSPEARDEVLARRGVEVVVGTGLLYAFLDEDPRWVRVFRNHNSTLYLRRSKTPSALLERITRYYAERGVPFDPARGFEPAQVRAQTPQWAIQHGLW